jgi:hypothetical protein
MNFGRPDGTSQANLTEEFVRQPDSTSALAFIHEESGWDFVSVDDVERINDVVESQLGRLPDEFVLAKFSINELPARLQEAAG